MHTKTTSSKQATTAKGASVTTTVSTLLRARVVRAHVQHVQKQFPVPVIIITLQTSLCLRSGCTCVCTHKPENGPRVPEKESVKSEEGWRGVRHPSLYTRRSTWLLLLCVGICDGWCVDYYFYYLHYYYYLYYYYNTVTTTVVVRPCRGVYTALSPGV